MKFVLGTMEFGRRLGPPETKKLLELYSKTPYDELDTASLYAKGETEKILGSFKHVVDNSKLKISTKVNPTWKKNGFNLMNLNEQFSLSLKHLDQDNVDILYLHWPSSEDDLEETLEAINNLYRQNKFTRFGISNYAAWQVMKIYSICEKRSFIKPTVYQGVYNMLTRNVELELLPCLRELGISFYAYSPLAGGLLTGRYKYDDRNNFNENTTPNRFHLTGGTWAKTYQNRYWRKEYFDALSDISNMFYNENKSSPFISDDPNFSTPDENLISLSLSWLKNYSHLSSSFGDAVIIGASSIEQYELNMKCFSQNMHISDSTVKKIDLIYKKYIDSACPKYYR